MDSVYLDALPIEVAVKIYTRLGSVADLIAVAGACQQTRKAVRDQAVTDRVIEILGWPKRVGANCTDWLSQLQQLMRQRSFQLVDSKSLSSVVAASWAVRPGLVPKLPTSSIRAALLRAQQKEATLSAVDPRTGCFALATQHSVTIYAADGSRKATFAHVAPISHMAFQDFRLAIIEGNKATVRDLSAAHSAAQTFVIPAPGPMAVSKKYFAHRAGMGHPVVHDLQSKVRLSCLLPDGWGVDSIQKLGILGDYITAVTEADVVSIWRAGCSKPLATIDLRQRGSKTGELTHIAFDGRQLHAVIGRIVRTWVNLGAARLVSEVHLPQHAAELVFAKEGVRVKLADVDTTIQMTS